LAFSAAIIGLELFGSTRVCRLKSPITAAKEAYNARELLRVRRLRWCGGRLSAMQQLSQRSQNNPPLIHHALHPNRMNHNLCKGVSNKLQFPFSPKNKVNLFLS
jgi:hypothetical protein